MNQREPFKYPQWQEPLFNAVNEIDPNQLRIKVQTAEELIEARLKALSGRFNSQEHSALLDAVRTLRALRQENRKRDLNARRRTSLDFPTLALLRFPRRYPGCKCKKYRRRRTCRLKAFKKPNILGKFTDR